MTVTLEPATDPDLDPDLIQAAREYVAWTEHPLGRNEAKRILRVGGPKARALMILINGSDPGPVSAPPSTTYDQPTDAWPLIAPRAPQPAQVIDRAPDAEPAAGPPAMDGPAAAEEPATASGRQGFRARGSGPFYAVAGVATLISINTSWRFFGDVLDITNPYERPALFGVLELALVACGYAMAHSVRRPGGKPGPARLLAWVLCGISAYMAIAMSGPLQGIARVLLGPVLALVCLHFALGIEIRVHRTGRTGTWARLGIELRERGLSRFGLADDARTALSRTRDRAAERAARLTMARWAFRRQARIARAIRASGATNDPAQRSRIAQHVATIRSLDDLRTADYRSMWEFADLLK